MPCLFERLFSRASVLAISLIVFSFPNAVVKPVQVQYLGLDRPMLVNYMKQKQGTVWQQNFRWLLHMSAGITSPGKHSNAIYWSFITRSRCPESTFHQVALLYVCTGGTFCLWRWTGVTNSESLYAVCRMQHAAAVCRMPHTASKNPYKRFSVFAAVLEVNACLHIVLQRARLEIKQNDLMLIARNMWRHISLIWPFPHRYRHSPWPVDVTELFPRFCCWTLIWLLRHWARLCRGYWRYRSLIDWLIEWRIIRRCFHTLNLSFTFFFTFNLIC